MTPVSFDLFGAIFLIAGASFAVRIDGARLGFDGRQMATTRPSHDLTQKLITFLYYADLPAAIHFYEHVLGLTLEIDQGWSKIFRVTTNGYVGLVDERRGSHRANVIKPVQICIRVADVDAWHAYIESVGVDGLRAPRSNQELRIRAFVFNDPEGYQIEIQSALD